MKMRTKKEIEDKIIELKSLYSKINCEDKPNSEECKSITTQIKFLELALKMKKYKT